MSIYAELKQLEKSYNLYEIDRETAISKAKELIAEFNKTANILATTANLPQKPTRVSLKNYSFGR